MAAFCERLTALREASGIKKKDLAVALHVSAGTISNYENGRHMPDVDTLIAIAAYFRVSMDYLLGLTDCRLPQYRLEEEYVPGVTLAVLINKLAAAASEERTAIALVVDAMYRCTGGQSPC